MKSMIAFWNILSKDMKNYYLKPPNISWGLIFPFAWILMMFLRTKTFNVVEIFPGIIGMSVLFGTTSMLAVTITFEKKSRSFERLLLAPISLELLITAKITGAILFGIFNSILPILISVFYFNASIYNPISLFLGVCLLSIISTLFGLFISVSAKEVFEAQTYSNFFRFPMIFLCGLFVPITTLPIYLRIISYLLPVTYAMDFIRYSIDKSNLISNTLSLILISVFCLLLFYISIHNMKKKWLK